MGKYAENCSDWQKEPFWITPDLIRLPKMANSGTCSGNTRILQVFPQNTADYRFKMNANGRFWEANLMGDRPELLVKEKKAWFGAWFFGYIQEV
jgi:hypothetical protein